jgi:predicted component of type VI protein secretion system
MESTVQIQINADGSLDRDPGMLEEVEESLRSTLGRFEDRITRVEVHLSDVNGDKGGVDTRCLIEARMAGKPPVAVEEQSDSVSAAVRGASGKLVRLLDTRIGRDRGH